jgi:hypothetical protein
MIWRMAKRGLGPPLLAGEAGDFLSQVSEPETYGRRVPIRVGLLEFLQGRLGRTRVPA